MILLIDDDKHVLDFIKTLLERAGYSVITSLDAESAKVLIEEHPIRLILLDLLMPKMSGNDFMEWLSQQHPIPVILITGQIHALKDEVRHIPAAVFEKPFDPGKLLETIGNALQMQAKAELAS